MLVTGEPGYHDLPSIPCSKPSAGPPPPGYTARWLNDLEAPLALHARYRLEGSSRVLLFVRERQKLANGLAEPFVFLGPVRMRSWKGERPMQIEWALEEAMPEWLYREAAVLAR